MRSLAIYLLMGYFVPLCLILPNWLLTRYLNSYLNIHPSIYLLREYASHSCELLKVCNSCVLMMNSRWFCHALEFIHNAALKKNIFICFSIIMLCSPELTMWDLCLLILGEQHLTFFCAICRTQLFVLVCQRMRLSYISIRYYSDEIIEFLGDLFRFCK